MKTTLSFKNDVKIKNELVNRMQKHIELDELVQGATGENGKGCTVWCALNNGELKKGYNHSAFPDVLGLPEWLGRLVDAIYEGLSVEDANKFSLDWVLATPEGKNLEPVKWKFCAFILKENIERVLLLDIAEDLKKQVVDSIKGVYALHQHAINTGEWNESARAAESAARSAARSAAESAARAAESAESAARSAARAAESAARAAESAAESAARSAARSARSAARAAESAESAARAAAYKRYADYLLKLLKAA